MANNGGELSIFSSNYEDIILEILLWLPVISLLRFRCVCKSWRALISTSDFIAKHRGRTNHNGNNKNILIIFKRFHHFRDPPSRFSQIVDYLSLKKKNVDFSQEKFRFFSHIKHKGCSMGTGLGTAGDGLFFYTSCIDRTNGFTIWVMMEYGVYQSWTILAKIRPEIFPPNVMWSKPISIMEDDEVLMISNKGDLILYIPEQHFCWIMLDTPVRYAQADIYVETLVLPVIGGASSYI